MSMSMLSLTLCSGVSQSSQRDELEPMFCGCGWMAKECVWSGGAGSCFQNEWSVDF